MENQETAKRTYKKHKEGYKIAVVHKLNARLKTHIYGENHSIYTDQLSSEEIRLLPLYVEVRAKRQNTYFRSTTLFLVAAEDFSDFNEDPLTQSFVLREKESIERHLRMYIESNEEDFQIVKWYNKYRVEQHNQSILTVLRNLFEQAYRKFFQEKSLDTFDFIELVYKDDNVQSMYHLACILRGLGFRDFNHIIDAMENFSKIYSMLSSRLPFELYVTGLNAHVDFRESLTLDNLFTNPQFNDKLVELNNMDTSSDLFENVTQLRKFLKENMIE